MKTPGLDAAQWRKSSYSNGGDGNCVEVAERVVGLVHVRDSKRPHRPALLFPAGAWTRFVTGLRRGDLAGLADIGAARLAEAGPAS